MLQARKIVTAPRPVQEPPAAAVGRLPAQKKDRRSKSALFLLVLVGFLLGLVIIAQYSSIVTLNYRLSRAESRIAALDEEYRELEQQAAGLNSLSRIESFARVELGMREPESGQLMVLTAVREKGFSAGE
ncbi:MAG: cell division protein FtsL [Firmicutes bacterium]|nr:cell division protein FtsL [Bacillota bacterium]